jgi:hypothetical protein
MDSKEIEAFKNYLGLAPPKNTAIRFFEDFRYKIAFGATMFFGAILFARRFGKLIED